MYKKCIPVIAEMHLFFCSDAARNDILVIICNI